MWECGRRRKSLGSSVEEDGERLGQSRGSGAAGTGGIPSHLHPDAESSEEGRCWEEEEEEDEESTGEALRAGGAVGEHTEPRRAQKSSSGGTAGAEGLARQGRDTTQSLREGMRSTLGTGQAWHGKREGPREITVPGLPQTEGEVRADVNKITKRGSSCPRFAGTAPGC